MKKIRICYFIGSLKIGGAQKHLVELINSLDRNLFEIFLVLATDDQGFQNLLKLDHDQILILNLKRYYGLSGLIGILKFTKFIRKKQIQILQSYLFECNIYAAILKFLNPKIILIMSIRNMNFAHGWLKVKALHYASYLASRVTVVSNRDGEFVIKRERINPKKVFTLYNAVDSNYYSDPEKYRRASKNNNPINIICVASLNYRKGHDTLFKAVHILSKRRRNIQLYLLGDGKKRADLECIVKELNISNEVTFCGYNKNVKSLLKDMDIGVLSSNEEGMSNALLEYMSMSLPVVTTDVGGNSEVNLNGITGFMVEPKDDQALAITLDQLIMNGNLRLEMGTSARKRIVSDFSLDVMKNAYTNFYFNIYTAELGVVETPSSR